MICFAAARTADEITLDIFDVIGDSWWGGISSKQVARFLEANDDASSIRVRINSPGGEVFEGTAIYNLLRDAKQIVRVQIISLAASMASVIALAGDTVEMAENALFMIHDPWALAIGSGDEMRKTAETLDKIKAAALTVYTGRSKLSSEEISALMSAETWMTGAEALEAGFVDGLIPVSDAPTAPTDDDEAKARARNVLAKFRHAPESVAALYQPRFAAMATPDPENTDPEITPMNEEQLMRLRVALGLPDDAKIETIIAAAEAKDTTESDDEAETVAENGHVAVATIRSPGLEELEVAQGVDLTKWVPREELDETNARLAKLEAKAHAERIDKALAANKKRIASPAYAKVLREQLASGALSFEAFDKIMAATPESRLTQEDEAENASERAEASLQLEQYELDFCAENDVDPKVFAEKKAKRIRKRLKRVI